MILPLILLGKIVSNISRLFNLGSGQTWPGEIALSLKPQILQYFISQLNSGVIIIAGTNGKTTSAKIIQFILNKTSKSQSSSQIVHNDSGANLLNGIVSAFIQKSDWNGSLDADWAVLEVDENTLPLLIARIKNLAMPAGRRELRIKNKKIIIVLLNLFRDQLDRYGEVDIIARKWEKALLDIKGATLILNADDPQISYLAKKFLGKIIFFGINKPDKFLKLKEHATDSTYCPNCGNKLDYKGIYFSHLGIWSCPKCKYHRPNPTIADISSPLPGFYNEYNTLAAASVGKELGIGAKQLTQLLKEFKPAFGRQEEIDIAGKKAKIFLSKNPAGFNASLRTVIELGAQHILLALNDRIPDGRDVSWIWDVDFEMIPETANIVVSGDRVYDMALRIKYSVKSQKSNEKLKIEEKLEDAINQSLYNLKNGETLYILPTYSAMLDVRKILKGRKIL